MEWTIGHLERRSTKNKLSEGTDNGIYETNSRMAGMCHAWRHARLWNRSLHACNGARVMQTYRLYIIWKRSSRFQNGDHDVCHLEKAIKKKVTGKLRCFFTNISVLGSRHTFQPLPRSQSLAVSALRHKFFPRVVPVLESAREKSLVPRVAAWHIPQNSNRPVTNILSKIVVSL